ncbi:MAG: serine--tRNA ligase, partial [Thermoplasmata archaeon]|nr:serine--tRNA ligase [Thermoplasmata archaeon]
GAQITRMKGVADQISHLSAQLREVEENLRSRMLLLPNIPDESVPEGPDKKDSVLLKEFGVKKTFEFKPKNHVEIAEFLDIIDFPRAARMTQSQFPLYKGLGAQLEWALISFMIDCQVRQHHYTLIIPPFMVNSATMTASGNLPKFASELYAVADDELYLIPTSEVTLCGMHMDEIIPEETLPLRYAAYTPCFRREADTYGADERGLIRSHQFNKVELFKFVTPGQSETEYEALIADAEEIIEKLGLHYQRVLLTAGDMAQQSSKTIDIEAYLPTQNAYYEVSSCSNCKTFQAIRGNIRFRPKDGGRPEYIHTQNGSGLATSRLMVALLETYQQPDGSVIIPEVLREHMGG